MKSSDDIKAELLSYIAQKQVASRFGDCLTSFIKEGEGYDSSDMND